MRRLTGFLPVIAITACLLGVGGTAARATGMLPPGLSAVQPAAELLLTFDNLGNGTIAIAGGPPSSLPGTLLDDPADPACPVCSPVLTYLLPASEPVITGDVAILAPDGLEIASWLRFTDDAGTISGAPTGAGGRMIFYFEPPFASNIGDGNFVIGPTETVSDGIVSFDYRPGGVPYPENNEFIGSVIGAAVPEPGSLALLAGLIIAMGLLAPLRSRRTD